MWSPPCLLRSTQALSGVFERQWPRGHLPEARKAADGRCASSSGSQGGQGAVATRAGGPGIGCTEATTRWGGVQPQLLDSVAAVMGAMQHLPTEWSGQLKEVAQVRYPAWHLVHKKYK